LIRFNNLKYKLQLNVCKDVKIGIPGLMNLKLINNFFKNNIQIQIQH